MCNKKGEGPRCFYHASADLRRTQERIHRDERVIAKKPLSQEETIELAELKARSSDLTTQGKKLDNDLSTRLSALQRISDIERPLSDKEVVNHLALLTKRDELEADLNVSAVAKGAIRKKELSLLRGDILVQFAKENTTAAKHHLHARTIRAFLERRAGDPDTPLSDAEARVADEIYFANAAHYNKGREVTQGNGKTPALTEAAYTELQELVGRYNELSPAAAPAKQRQAHATVQVLREAAISFATATRDKLTELEAASLSSLHLKFHQHKNRREILAFAVTQDRRIERYGLLAIQAKKHFPKLYNAAVDREDMEAARASLPFGPSDERQPHLIARHRAVVESEEHLRAKRFDRFGPSDMRTTVTPSLKLATGSNAEVDKKAQALGANRAKPDVSTKKPQLAAHLDNSAPKAKPVASAKASVAVPASPAVRKVTTTVSASTPAPAATRELDPVKLPSAATKAAGNSSRQAASAPAVVVPATKKNGSSPSVPVGVAPPRERSVPKPVSVVSPVSTLPGAPKTRSVDVPLPKPAPVDLPGENVQAREETESFFRRIFHRGR